jgi:hypothetical protein
MTLNILNKYKNNYFIFKNIDRLVDVCNAPSLSSGLYVIYAFENGKYNLIYIGISGRVLPNGEFAHRKGGIKDRFLKGKQFGERRQIAWTKKLEEENIEHIKIHWYETYDGIIKDIPREIEEKLLKQHYLLNGSLPRWNNKF